MAIRTMMTALLLASTCFAQVTLREFVNDLPGDVYDATLSPAGDRVALSWCHGVAPNYSCGVFLRPSTGGEPKLLFVGRELVQQLRWSPDGKWLAYTDLSGHNSTGLMVRPIGGGEATPVAEICWGGYTWTADSQGFIVSAPRGSRDSAEGCGLWAYSRDGKRIAVVAAKGYSPAVSPDGRALAFVRDHSIFVRGLRDSFQPTGPERRIATEDTNFTGLVWVAGGKELIYATRLRSPLHRVSLNSTTRLEIVGGIDDQTEIVSLDQSSSGAIIAEVFRHDRSLWRMDLRSPRRHFEKLQAISHTDDTRHSVSPDGLRVAFAANGALWTSDLDGSNASLVARHREVIVNPRWSPDGRWIGFSGDPAEGNADSRSRLYVVAASGGAPRRLLPGIDNVTFQNWSRDGKWLYASRESLDLASDVKPQLWKVNAASGSLIQVTKDGGFAGEESANGDWLYYTASPYPKLHRVPVSGGTETELPVTRLGPIFGGAFAVGQESIFFVPDGPNYGDKRVLRFDVASEAVTTVANTDFVPLTLQLSRDERYLFATSDPAARHSHVILEGFR